MGLPVGTDTDRRFGSVSGRGRVLALEERGVHDRVGELAVLAAVVLVLYGRSGVLKSRQFQTIWPWISPVRRTTDGTDGGHAGTGLGPAAASSGPDRRLTAARRRARPRLFRLDGNRVFWFLTILAATAVAAWIVTRLLILNGAGTAQPSEFATCRRGEWISSGSARRIACLRKSFLIQLVCEDACRVGETHRSIRAYSSVGHTHLTEKGTRS